MAIIGFAVAVLCVMVQFRLTPTWISGTAWGMFFFAMGYSLKNLQWNRWIALASLVLLIASYFTSVPNTYCDGNPTTLKYAVWLVISAFACIAFNNICKYVVSVLTKFNLGKAFPILRYVGQHSMIYYVGHYIIFRISYDTISVVKPEWYSTWQGLVVTFIAYGIILTAINEFSGRLGNRDGSVISTARIYHILFWWK